MIERGLQNRKPGARREGGIGDLAVSDAGSARITAADPASSDRSIRSITSAPTTSKPWSARASRSKVSRLHRAVPFHAGRHAGSHTRVGLLVRPGIGVDVSWLGLRELLEKVEQRATLVDAQGGEDLGLDLGEDRVEPFERRGAGGGELDKGLAPVAWVGPAGDQ